ncbi:MAG: radical SAM protein [Prolixibacteraceae bacterium]|nr:radical SAM protein [Prolixibacteraceae bacterium]
MEPKILLESQELLQENNVKRIVPKVAWLNVNRGCNLRCKWCYAQNTNYLSNKEMSLDFAKEMALLLKNLGIRKISIIGGEPTLWQPLFEFNRFCIENKINTSLVTNGMRFGNDKYWAEYQEHPNISAPWCSLKAFDLKSLQDSCGVSNFQEVSIGLKRALEFFKCGVSFVYNSCYSDNLLDMARYSMELGAKSVRICPCTPAFVENIAIDEYMIETGLFISNVVKNYDKLCEITKNKLSFSMKMPLCLWPKDFIEMLIQKKQMTSTCQVQKRSGIIFDTDGKVILCNFLFDYPIGTYNEDFNDHKSLLDLLNSDKILDYYDRINSYPSHKCIGCPKYSICSGGCPLNWAVNNPEEIIKGWN